ncbi:MAG TPA: RDD family protein [Thermoanaerobaculia bacterium]
MGSPLQDFPLRGEREVELPDPFAPRSEAPASAAPLAARWPAAAADAAAVVLLAALPLLGARAASGQTPRLSGIAWVIGFLLYLFLFATLVPLVLFGKTVGMALANLSVQRPGREGSHLSIRAALRRWVGTIATAATAGLPLLWTARHPEAPTLADRLSGHPLTVD